jgi:hypothetical protein
MRKRMRPWLAIAVLLAGLGAGAPQAAATVAPPRSGPDAASGPGLDLVSEVAVCRGPVMGTLALARPSASFLLDAPRDDPDGPLALSLWRRGARTPKAPRATPPAGALGASRARILLRSLTLPGWGQATLGRRTSAAVFGVTEAAIWGTFTAFRLQVAMREDAFLRTARLQAGIDVRGRDEEWRRIIGGYASSDEYNWQVVAWDAARLYLSDPAALDYGSYYDYIEKHKLKGADTWKWSSEEAQRRYRDLRKTAQRAAQRANTVLAVAVANRIVSALHAARVAGHPAPAHSWQFEVAPGASEDATAFQFRVRARF